MTNRTQRNAAAAASSGLKKLSNEQVDAIKKVFDMNDTDKIAAIEKLVNKTLLFKITGESKYAPAGTRNLKAEQLNKILFS